MPAPPATRTLVVMRHAKAEAAGPTDAERPLATRGREDAADAGSWLARAGVVPDVALVSAARRTQQTWAALAGAAGWELAPQLSEELYQAAEDDVLAAVRRVGEEHPDPATVVVVGHNPTMHGLVLWLADGEGDPAAETAVASSYPTAAVSVLDVTVPWADLEPGGARLRDHHVGRGSG